MVLTILILLLTIAVTHGDVDYLLPETIQPMHYDVKFITNIENFDVNNEETFSYGGEVVIQLHILTEISEIILHRHSSITINHVAFKPMGGTPLSPAIGGYDQDTEKQRIMMTGGGKIAAGDYFLHISFKGHHSEDMRGFFRSSYINEIGETRWFLATNLSPIFARHAFPCFDEPKLKATFTIIIDMDHELITKGYNVQTIMPLESIERVNRRDVFTFPNTQILMSTYLTSVVISDFVGSPEITVTPQDKPLRSWGRQKYITEGDSDVARLLGAQILETISNITSTKFVNRKLDLIAVPGFPQKSVEGWGSALFRESYLFFNESRDSISVKQTIVTSVAHEIAHLWFGNLITAHWWSDIWLSEGVASFLEYYATDKVVKEWNLLDQMVVDVMQTRSFDLDGEEFAPPMTSPVSSPNEVVAKFDVISRDKGASVMRMWLHVLGEYVFFKSMHSYLYVWQVQSAIATPEALFKSFEDNLTNDDQLKGNISTIFKDWHLMPGYPVLHVSRSDGGVHVYQERFFWTKESVESNWFIPLTFTTDIESDFSSTQPAEFLTTNETFIDIDDDFKWIVMNIQQIGYYRVNYDTENWQALATTLNETHKIIHAINRAQIINDVFSLARTTNNYTSYSFALELISYLPEEEELVPWKAAFHVFDFLMDKLSGTYLKKFEIYVGSLMERRYQQLTLEVNDSDSHTTRILRSLIAARSCKVGVADCIEETIDIFAANEYAHPDVVSTVLCTTLQNGASTWDNMWNEYSSVLDKERQSLYIHALGCTKDKTVLEGYLQKTLDLESDIKRENYMDVFDAVLNGGSDNIPVAFEFLKTNLEEIAQRYVGLNPVGDMLTSIARKLNTKDDLDLMIQLANEINNSTSPLVQVAATKSDEAILTISNNIVWMETKLEQINAWLDEYIPDPPKESSALSLAVSTSMLIFILTKCCLF